MQGRVGLVYANHAAAEAGAGLAREIAAKVAAELETYDPGFTCDVQIADGVEVEAINEDTALAFVRAIRLAPNGVMRRNLAADGAVDVSSNIGVVATSADEATILLSPRSSRGVQGSPADPRRRPGLRREVRVRVPGLELRRALSGA